MSLIPYEKLRGGRIYDIDLAAPAQERWLAFGREMGDDLHELLADVVKLCEENLSGVPRMLRPLAKAAMHGASRLGGSVIGTIAGWYGGEYVAEIKGLAAAAEVPFSQVLLSNLMYDACQASERLGSATACSSYSCNVRGKPVLARNLDWNWPDSIGRHTILIRFHRGRRSYLSVGVVGMVGVLSAMFEGHWAVTFNQCPARLLPFNCFQWPSTQRLRAAADGFGSLGSLVRRLVAYQTMSPFFAHVIGVGPNQHVVVNGMGREFSHRRIDGPMLIQTNHFIGEDEHLNPPDEETDRDGTVWTYDTRPRYKALERRLQRLPTSLATAMQVLSRPPVTVEATQQQMCFSPATGRWLLRVRT